MKQSKANVSFNDSGFLFGDGIFETIRFTNKKLFAIEKHIERLKIGIKTIQLNDNISIEKITTLLREVLKVNNISNGLLKLILTRGELESEPWNHNSSPSIYITIRPFKEFKNIPLKVIFLEEKDYPIIRFHPAIKSMSYIGNVIAKIEAKNLNANEPVFINNQGIITECAIRNIFFVKNNTLLTPKKELGILPGIVRETIIKIAKKNGMETIETKIHRDTINNMDEAFLSSSGIGILPCRWKNWNSNYKYTLKLKNDLFNYIKQNSN
tara:strand:+ start:7020 stop:7823 length:804 start_codon:yes stop_codon:yes gene_type:complete